MNNKIEQLLLNLYRHYAFSDPVEINILPVSGSYRTYYRILTTGKSVIGVHNEDAKENEAFFAFTNHFFKLGLPVPEILAISELDPVYLLSDLGDQTLFSLLTAARGSQDDFPDEIITLYKKVIEWLPRFQINGNKELDYSKCYPRAAFDRQSMMWDLNYFKYYFLKLAKIPFDEQKLEDDFKTLTDFLLTAESDYFMYRDFQSRNIMIVKSEPWFVDYQGGRKGPLQYDIASLLYDAKAAIPEPIREELLSLYLLELGKLIRIDKRKFRHFYNGFVLIRILQALGAYGFRGYYENKLHFLESVPYALTNLKHLIDDGRFPDNLPALQEVLERIIRDPGFLKPEINTGQLLINLESFSYKNGIPRDTKGHGGGFVFDCRALPNPGRNAQFQNLTGKDLPVKEFLENEPEVNDFLQNVYSLVDQSVQVYLERNFTSLSVAFGCTGGQHRSVFCAESLARHLEKKFNVRIDLKHTQINR